MTSGETYTVGVKRGGASSFLTIGSFASLELARQIVRADSRGRGREASEYHDDPGGGQWTMRAGDDTYLIQRSAPRG